MTFNDRDCLKCGVRFTPVAAHHQYCTTRCRKKWTKPKLQFPVRPCEHCAMPFVPVRRHQRFCNPQCQTDAYNTGRGAFPRELKIASSTVGAISELIVAVDLMRRGKHVFRALSPACPCDLAYIEGDRLITVEVRTGTRMKSGRLCHTTDRMRSTLLAVVVHGETEVVYDPAI